MDTRIHFVIHKTINHKKPSSSGFVGRFCRLRERWSVWCPEISICDRGDYGGGGGFHFPFTSSLSKLGSPTTEAFLEQKATINFFHTTTAFLVPSNPIRSDPTEKSQTRNGYLQLISQGLHCSCLKVRDSFRDTILLFYKYHVWTIFMNFQSILRTISRSLLHPFGDELTFQHPTRTTTTSYITKSPSTEE